MKPCDHPEFFSFPAPAGQSRESSIVLKQDGTFLHEGTIVEHPAMARAFAMWLQRHPHDGRFILSNGYDWTYISVEDAPFIVTRLAVDIGPPPTVSIELSDGTTEALDLETLRLGANDAVYCSVKHGAYAARFTPQAQLKLEPLLVESEAGIELELGGRRFQLSQ